MDIYKARWENAKKLFQKMIDHQEKGGIIFNEDLNLIGELRFEDDEILENIGLNCTQQWFKNNKDFDHGLYTPIKEFNKQFKDWKMVFPENLTSVI